jgi:multidrug resistance efflux pump
VKRLLIVVAIVAVLAVAAGSAWQAVARNPEWVGRAREHMERWLAATGLGTRNEPALLVASGFIEANEVAVATEVGGRIIALYGREGDEVGVGEVLVVLEDSLLRAQIVAAEADVAAAEANLAAVKAGVRQESLDHAVAISNQAKAAREAARMTWEDAEALAQNPQDLELAITAAKATVAVARLQEQQAMAWANSAQSGWNLADEIVRELEEFEPYSVDVGPQPIRVKLPADALPKAQHEQAVAAYRSWEAWAGVAQAQAAVQGAESHLAYLLRQSSSSLALEAQANAARGAYETASAVVEVAQAQLDGLKIGATVAQLQIAEAQVQVARSALEALQVQLGKYQVQAPISGLVLARAAHEGELALPGVPMMKLGDLDELTLTVYVPVSQLGGVRLGRAVTVTVDSYPDRAFEGRVSYVAGEAEFVPRNVQTREDRVNMVFAVRVSLPNPDHALKPGMPADATIGELHDRK